MCNIAGYIGKKEAVPILIEMMSKEEGWDAAFFTGCAVMDQGKIRMEKVVGPLQTLLDTTDIANAKGNTGIMHSRTPGKKTDDFQWSHPFISDDGRIVSVYNCSSGIFKNTSNAFRSETYNMLKEAGYGFASLRQEPTEVYGDVRVHTCDLLNQYTVKLIHDGMEPVDALEKVRCEIPLELAMLMLSSDEPDCILYSKTTYPMFLGLAEHGIYLATTPQAFPDDAERILYLSSMTAGRVYRDHYTVKPFAEPPMAPAAITPTLWKTAYDTCVEMIRQQPRKYPELEKAVRAIFLEQQPGKVPAEAPVVYSILYDLEKTGKTRKIIGSVPGQLPDTTVPKFYAEWIGE